MTAFESFTPARIDFNSIEEDGTIRVPLRRLIGVPPASGEALTLEDLEGHTCTAVVEVSGPYDLAVRPIWATWRPAEDEIFMGVTFTSAIQTSPNPIEPQEPVRLQPGQPWGEPVGVG